jgi:hypothetical protein
MLDRLRLLIAEERLKSHFGKLKKYRYRVVEEGITDTKAKLRIAREVLAGPGVGVMEAWWYELRLKEHGVEA